ncbi:DUF4040 domain-containing protein [Wolbachia pipientis]|uniref:DUF4040 domain-containing protein n=1 Tax=Wolbachia pipientis TaxID=955 RepID=UPI0025A3758A|nr:DUF4040 domain-containing protein [Wolbachia pipientis]MDM8335125.1 DUF4040 domain-containing protein [Wolbachia pipientis]
MLEILNVILLLLLLTVTVFIVLSKHLVVIGVLMCAFSSFIALMYLIMNAPDVAITEASVGAGLSTVFTFAALSLIKDHKVNLSYNPITLFFMSFLAVCLSYFMIQLPDFGNHDAPIHSHVAPYYIENTERVTGILNIVTAILASFRGYDTFGETIVVFTAALCITLILKEEKEND